MKSILVGRCSNQISFALNDEAIQQLIEKLKYFQKNKIDTRFSVETTGQEIDLVFVPFDIQDKRIQEFFKDKEEFESIRDMHRRF